MSESKIAIVGSGIVGTSIAHVLTEQGFDVAIFEKGPEYPYPHTQQFQEQIVYNYDNSAFDLTADIKNLTVSGDYTHNLNTELAMVVGGTATHWEAITLRMNQNDFKRKTVYGYGDDWPLDYPALEPYYCKAEALLGVSGTDADNPFAPPRSKPFPLPPFQLSYNDRMLAEKLREHDLVLHTTPQARTRNAYDGRPGCANYATCKVCPIGARYSPNFHLQRAMETGLCTLHSNVSVRRIVFNDAGKARALVYQENDGAIEMEHGASIIIVAAGAIESPRLLLLSTGRLYPDGPGNKGGNVGKNLTFHHIWRGNLWYDYDLLPGRFGGWTGQSHQFRDPINRARGGGIKVEFSSRAQASFIDAVQGRTNGLEIVDAFKEMRRMRPIALHGESVASTQKYVALSEGRDRFGDPFAHVHYQSSDFDLDTYELGVEIFERYKVATNAARGNINSAESYDSGSHHMGTCRMGRDSDDSVVDQFGKVHDVDNLFVVGGSNFVGTSGSMNPTLTMVAIALRTADYIMDQLL